MKGMKRCLNHIDIIRDAVSNGVPDKVDEVVKARTDGANSAYASAQFVGYNDVTVTSNATSRTDKSWEITASGNSLLFIEFGTGIIYPHNNPIDHPYNFAGSWSIEHKQYLTDSEKLARYKGKWPDPYSGKLIEGNPSANVMYQTGKTIKSTLPGELKRVLDEAVKS